MAVKAGCGGSFDGLCCRMVIEVKRVFDGCRLTDENVTLTLTTEAAIPPQSTFVGARVIGSELTGYSITDGNDGCSRVVGEIVTRFAVTYESGGVLTTVEARHSEEINVLLRLPNNAIVPFAIEVQSVMNVNGGAIIGTNAVSVSGCLLRIIKVVANVDILVPTYGYCSYPPCTGCACQGFFDRQVFPTLINDDF